MSSKLRPKYSIRDYLDIEAMSQIKHEYFQGDIFAMTGASFKHNLIKQATSQTLSNQLMDRDCVVLDSDMRVKTQSDFYTYPDVVVVCGDVEIENMDGKETLLNPLVIVEVLSKTTENYDKNGKFELYKDISSFCEYVLIDQYQPHVLIYTKQIDHSWLVSAETTDISSVVSLSTIDCTLAMNHIYRKVKF
jgi:Uma2 family endonuclease